MLPAAQKSLSQLQEGNRRFVNGEFTAKIDAKRRQEILAGQHPFATILTCSDSRVVPEYIFDQGLGEIFIIRTAGEVLDEIALASIEYGVEHLHTPLVVVLGHSLCGAVTATVTHAHVEGHLPALVQKIQPSVDACAGTEKSEGTGKVDPTALVKHWCVTEKGHTNTRGIHLHGLFYAREGQTKWQEIENRIQTSRESIEQSNMKAAAANADKAIEDWKIS